MISSLVDEKKRKKKTLLMSAALELFLSKGSEATSIDDIVRRAGVAKGTFYLYFHDRNEILREIISEKSKALVTAAASSANGRQPVSESEGLLFVVEELIDEFTHQPGLLGLIYRNMSWGMPDADPGLGNPAASALQLLGKASPTTPESARMAYVVMELVTSISYSSIILGEPAGIDVMKPFLLSSIRRLLSDEATPKELGAIR